MATTRILKLTNTEAIVKVYGAVGSATVDLDVDLKLANETIVGTPEVNIVALHATGGYTGLVTVTRNSDQLYAMSTEASSPVELLEIGGASDSTNNTSDIVIATSGAESQLLLKLRKISGYQLT